MLISIQDNVTGTRYDVNTFNIAYFYKRVTKTCKMEYCVVLTNNFEIIVTHKQWKKLKKELFGIQEKSKI